MLVYKWRILPVVGNGSFCLWYDWGRLLPVVCLKWRLLPVFWLVTTFACGLIEGDFCLWFVRNGDFCQYLSDGDFYLWLMGFILRNGDFCPCLDWWQLLPVFEWWWFPPMVDWLVFIPRNGDLCLWCLDWWRLLPVFRNGDFCQNGWLMGFIPRNGNLWHTSNGWASPPRNVYFTIRDFIMGCYLFNGLLPLQWLNQWIVTSSMGCYLFSGLSPLQWRLLVRFAPSVAWPVEFCPLSGLTSKICPFSDLISELCPFTGSELCPFNGLTSVVTP